MCNYSWMAVWTVSTLTLQQYGTWDGSTWTDSTGVIGGTNEVWAQWIKPPTISRVEGWTLFVPPGFSESGTLNIWGTVVPTTVNFSTSSPPKFRNSTLHSTHSFSWSGLFPQVLQPPFNDSVNGQRLILAAQIMSRQVADSNSNHRIAVRFTWSGSGGTWATAPSLTLSHEENPFTGLSGPYLAEGRADECPRCGRKSTRDTWVRDGYREIMICGRPGCYDPPDLSYTTNLPVEREGIGEG